MSLSPDWLVAPANDLSLKEPLEVRSVSFGFLGLLVPVHFPFTSVLRRVPVAFLPRLALS